MPVACNTRTKDTAQFLNDSPSLNGVNCSLGSLVTGFGVLDVKVESLVFISDEVVVIVD